MSRKKQVTPGNDPISLTENNVINYENKNEIE